MIDINKIPKHWTVKKLGEIAEYLNGRAFKPTEWENEGLPIIRIQNLNKPDATYNYTSNAYEDKYKVKNGDLLFAWSASLGVYIWGGKEAWLNQHIFKVVPKNNCHKKYLYFILEKITIELYAKAHGSGMIHITKGKFEATEIPFPPLSEQQAIVAKIEELLSELENGKKQLLTAQAQLKVYRQSLLKWAFEGKLTSKDVKEGELPEGWRWVKLGDICNISGGVTKGKDYNGKATIHLPYLRVANVQDGYLDLNIIKTIEVLTTDLEKYRLKYGDVLYTEGGDKDKLGRGTIWKNEITDCIHQNHIFRARPISEKINSKYITYYSQSKSAKQYFFKNGKQTTNLASINLTILSNLNIPLCSSEEQNQIIFQLESKLTVCDKLEETISQNLLKAETLKQSILKKAFEGKLLVNQEVESNIIKPVLINVPKVINGISITDLHAGIIAMVIDAHENAPQHLAKLNHVKGEKIAHLVEYKLGISLGRNPVKDAAGPDDYNHLKKVEHRANMANWFGVRNLDIGHTYYSKPSARTIINKIEANVSKEELADINKLIATFLPFTMEHAEIVATLFAGWNNLLLAGKLPTDEEIIYESRENWSERKLKIEREKFVKTLQWMKEHSYIPEGTGKMVLKSQRNTLDKKKKLKKDTNKGNL